jgi:CxxC-x17-CxxC domain-containing protein
MAFEDQQLQCVECGEPFIFSASEQEFYAEKELTHPPKRCKTCRKNAKKRRRSRKPQAGEYRSPAFSDSEFKREQRYGRNRRNQPKHQQQAADYSGEYRSPAFKEYEAMDNADEYRAPGFKEYENINAEEEYRSPAFKEYEDINPRDEYRAPAFGNSKRRGRVERPMFEIICVACGETAMVPFVPEEKEDPMCPACFKEHKILLAKERAEERKKEIEAKKEQEAAAKQAVDDSAADNQSETQTDDQGSEPESE